MAVCSLTAATRCARSSSLGAPSDDRGAAGEAPPYVRTPATTRLRADRWRRILAGVPGRGPRPARHGIDLNAEGRGGLTLAHEFGHSLGLTHEECDPSAPNVMAVGCGQAGASHSLTVEQIQLAREQARIGPVRGLSER